MKTKLVFLLLLIVCFSCGTNNKPLSDAQKEKIKGEVKEVVNTFFKGSETANFDMALQTCYDSPDFIYVYNGTAFGYKDCVDVFKPVFSTQINQKITIIDEKYAFQDNSTVIYTANCKLLANYKDGHSVLEDPAVMMFTFKKIDSKWKIVYAVESSVEQGVKNPETSKGLNQVELMKQLLGTWKGETSKDTTMVTEYLAFGSAMIGNDKVITKGKTINSLKELWGYDKKSDKIIGTELSQSSLEITSYAIWFTSKNIFEAVPLQDISNPDNAILKFKIELKSPDKFVETVLQNNKVVSTMTFNRLKN